MVPFNKQLPRDNKMFFISEAHNLDNKPLTTPMIDRLQHFDTVKDMIKLMNNRAALGSISALGGTHLSNQVLENGAVNLKIKKGFEMPKKCRTSLNRYKQDTNSNKKMTLEEKLLSGYYRVGQKDQMDGLVTSSDDED